MKEKGLSEYEKLHPLTQRLLERRGLTNKEEIEKFLNPSYDEDLHDPFLLKDMDKAVSRILEAIKNKEEIVIYTDYDTDGIPSGVILHDFFKKIGYTHFRNYIPHRHKEGYGLNKSAIEHFAKEGATLLITADCGITDVEEVEHAQKLGIDVIVTDHHSVGEVLPPAYAVINPQRKDDTYPFPYLCGCGVAFKLITALIKEGAEKNIFEINAGWEKWLLDMVGVATISDMVPLQGENRVLAHYGLKVLRKSPRLGLVNLLRKARVPQQHIIEDDVGFVIGPRINAASRMDAPLRAFEMLVADKEEEAIKLVSFLDSLNTKRKAHVALMVKEARKKLEERDIGDVIVLGNPDWQPGLLGLVANTLAEEYGKCAFLWGRGGDEETIKGSCRSNGLVNIVSCMKEAEDAFIGFGGHKASGGFSVSDDKIHELEERLNEAYKKTPQEEEVSEEEENDGELPLSDVHWDTYRHIEKLAPFGIGNPRPRFHFKDSEVGDVRLFGKGKEHLELTLQSEDGRRVKAIVFFANKDERYGDIEKGQAVSFYGYLERNIFLGKHELRIRIAELAH